MFEFVDIDGNNFADGSMKLFTKGNYKVFRRPEICRNHKIKR